MRLLPAPFRISDLTYVSVVVALLCSAACRPAETVTIRDFPYPNQAALAICSDIDETVQKEFLPLQRFLCTDDSTTLGRGLGLEIGSSFWMYNQYFQFLRDSNFTFAQLQEHFPGAPDSGLSWFVGTSDSASEASVILRSLIMSGFVDCLHSYGHFADVGFTRKLAIRSVRALRDAGITIDVFINHNNNNPNNMGAGDQLRGDDPSAVEYHADWTIDSLGVKFLWSGRLTHRVGQGGRPTFTNLFKALYEWIRTRLSGGGMISTLGNELVKPLILDDGHRVFDFVRFISPWGGIRQVDAASLALQIAPEVLDELTANHGCSIIYTHLGRNGGLSGLPRATIEALRELKHRDSNGEIWVTTTSRLLRYYVSRRSLRWHHEMELDTLFITVDGIENEVEGSRPAIPDDLLGITFLVPFDRPVVVLLGGKRIDTIENPPDKAGRRSISIPPRRLVWPEDELPPRRVNSSLVPRPSVAGDYK